MPLRGKKWARTEEVRHVSRPACPAAPTGLATPIRDPRDYAHSARASADGQRAYVSYWDAGVIILDISDPAEPRVEGRVIDRSFDGNFHSADEMDGLALK